jgi:exopolysaccharide biosynthesis polyprenyl glycosylphosphotransferase
MGRRRSHLVSSTALAIVDILLIGLGFWLAWWARYVLELGAEVAAGNYLPWTSYLSIQLILTGVLLAIYRLQGLYGRRARQHWADELGIIVWGTLVGIAAVIVGVFYFRPFSYSRLIFVYAWIAIVVLLALSRAIERAVRDYWRRKGVGLTRILVVGAGPVGRAVVQNMVAQPELGYQVVGLVDDERDGDIGRYEWLGRTEDVPELVAKHDVDEVVIALPSASHRKISDILLACAKRQVSFRIVPDVYQLSLNQLDVVELNGIPLIGLSEPALAGSSLIVKRAIDVVASAGLLVLLSPLVGLIALAIRLDSPGPVFVKQTRVGRYGRPFAFYKFRSMCQDADKRLKELLTQNEASGPVFKIRDDPRRTRVGRIIRRLSIDELPQLFNILQGDMSLVGPRPPFPWEVDQYEEWHRKRLEVPQGLTGLSQVSGRSDLPFDETALLDLWYIENWSLALDLKILLRTVPAVLLARGAY